MGVGAKPEGWDLAVYVLGWFDKSERKLVDEALLKAAEAVEIIAEGDFDKAMNKFN